MNVLVQDNDFNHFNDLKNYKIQIEIILKTIKDKIDILKNIYKEYHDKPNIYNQDKSSLDSLNNQLFLINTENENYKNILSLFLNKIYGEYYQLYKNLNKFIKPFIDNNIIDFKLSIEYPQYKLLDFSIVYEFNYIENINNDINNIINNLIIHINEEKEEIKIHEFHRDKGVHLNNFVNEKKYNINMIEEKTKFYNNIFSTYKQLQNKFIKRLLLKLQILYYQLEFDINIENDNNTENKLKNLTEIFGKKNIFIDKHFEENIFTKIKDLDNNIFLREDNAVDLSLNVHQDKSNSNNIIITNDNINKNDFIKSQSKIGMNTATIYDYCMLTMSIPFLSILIYTYIYKL